MKSKLSMFLAAAIALAACSAVPPPAERPSGREQTLVELQAVVAGVDQKRRLLSLRGDDGTIAVLPIAEEFRDFEKLRVGDLVVASYTEAVAWQVKPAQVGAPGVTSRQTLSNPRPGEAAGGAIEQSITVVTTITAFDPALGTVTLTGPQGRPQTVRVRNPSDLQHLRVGDLVEITFSEVRALARREAAVR